MSDFLELLKSAGGILGTATTAAAGEIYRRFRSAEVRSKDAQKDAQAAFVIAGQAKAHAANADMNAKSAYEKAAAAESKADQALQKRLMSPAGGTIAVTPPTAEIERVMRSFYDLTLKRAISLDWDNFVDDVRHKVREQVEELLRRHERRSRPDDLDPLLQERLDRLESRVEQLANEVRASAQEDRQSWREFDRLIGEMREAMRSMRRR